MSDGKTAQAAQEFVAAKSDLVTKYGKIIAEGAAPSKGLAAEVQRVAKLGKITPQRLCSVITQDYMERHPGWQPGKSSETKLREDYAVFWDDERRTCIRVAQDSRHVQFIPMATDLTVYELTHYEFEKQYGQQVPDYPVKKAAEMYLKANWLTIQESARKHLEYLCGKTFVDPIRPTNFQNKESIMTEAAKEKAAKTNAKAPAKTKAAGAKKSPAKAPAPVKGKPEAKAPVKAAKEPAEKAAPMGSRALKSFSGKKIQLVEKTNPKREGSAAHGKYALYKDGMTTEKFLEAGGTAADLAYDSKKGYIKLV